MVYALTMFLIVSALAPYVSTASEISPQRALLCTSMGYQWVDVNPQDDSQLSSNTPCVYCLLSSTDDSDGIVDHLHNAAGTTVDNLNSSQALNSISSATTVLHALPRAPPHIL